MSKTPHKADPAQEYDFSEGVRGKYAARHAEGTNAVLLEPDVLRFFPDSRSVNEALRLLIRAAHMAGEDAHGLAGPRS